MHRNPGNSFFREVATVLHDTEMGIRVEGNWFTLMKNCILLFFFVEGEEMDTRFRMFIVAMRFESRLINLSGKENYRL